MKIRDFFARPSQGYYGFASKYLGENRGVSQNFKLNRPGQKLVDPKNYISSDRKVVDSRFDSQTSNAALCLSERLLFLNGAKWSTCCGGAA